MSLHIETVVEKGLTYPMIINFQNGYTTDDFQTITCTVLDNEKDGKRSVATELEDIVYAGNEVNEDLGNTFVLARNRKTGKVRLIEVGCADIKPFFCKDNPAVQLKDTSTLELSRKFGSKKSKKMMEQHEKLKVNVETVTEQMKNATKNVTEDKIDLAAYIVKESEEFYIPPINRAAKSVEEVYDLNSIFSEEQFQKIYDEAYSKDYAAEYSVVIKSIVGDKELSLHHTVLALYASALYKIYQAHVKELIKKTFVICNVSPTLSEIILKNFTQGEGKQKTRSPMYKDKALCYAIVLSLLLNNYKLDLDLLCSTVALSPKVVSLKARATGASIVTSGKKKIIQLKVPLPSAMPLRRKSAKF